MEVELLGLFGEPRIQAAPRQQPQVHAPYQRQVRQCARLVRPRPVLPQRRIPPPVIPNLHPAPVLPTQINPSLRRSRLLLLTGQVIPRFFRHFAALLPRHPTLDAHDRAAVRKSRRHRFDRAQLHPPFFHAPVVAAGLDKRGEPPPVCFRACASNVGWLPLICRK